MVKGFTFVIVVLFLAVALVLFAVPLIAPASGIHLVSLLSCLSLLVFVRTRSYRLRAVVDLPRSPPRA